METINIMTDLKERLRKEITGTNIALFTTSDIFSINEPQHYFAMRKRDGIAEPHKDYGLRAEYTLESGEVRRFWTKGTLERAIEQGYVVWVVSTRKNLGPTNSWWTKLVPGSQTMLCGPDLASIWRERVLEHFSGRISDDAYCDLGEKFMFEDHLPSLPYWVWAITADIQWPVQGEGEYRVPAFWTSGLAELEEKGFFVRGHSFRDRKGENAIKHECYEIIKARRTPEEQAEHDAKVAKAKAKDAARIAKWNAEDAEEEYNARIAKIDASLDAGIPVVVTNKGFRIKPEADTRSVGNVLAPLLDKIDKIESNDEDVICNDVSDQEVFSLAEAVIGRPLFNEDSTLADVSKLNKEDQDYLIKELDTNDCIIRNGSCVICGCAGGEGECNS